jgi:hypothetical protein
MKAERALSTAICRSSQTHSLSVKCKRLTHDRYVCFCPVGLFTPSTAILAMKALHSHPSISSMILFPLPLPLPYRGLSNHQLAPLPIAAFVHCCITHHHRITFPACSPHLYRLPIVALPQCRITTSLHCRITASLHCRITASLHCRITASPHHHIAASPHRRIVTLPHCRYAKMSHLPDLYLLPMVALPHCPLLSPIDMSPNTQVAR